MGIGIGLGPDKRLKEDFADPPSLTFASTTVGTTDSDSPQQVTVSNIGNTTLTLPVPGTGQNPSVPLDFGIDGNRPASCFSVPAGAASPGTISAGQSCFLYINFTPTSAGTLSESVVLTDDDLNAAGPGYTTQTIQLTGTGTAP